MKKAFREICCANISQSKSGPCQRTEEAAEHEVILKPTVAPVLIMVSEKPKEQLRELEISERIRTIQRTLLKSVWTLKIILETLVKDNNLKLGQKLD